uniref:Cytochrome b n=1 Tax=Eulimnogammarus vittatus TaxID=58370 RepID=A0A0U1XH73_EULVI|nr:cytochrome b [Eulimnogammarus vittatus]AIT99454.1 cytochrome b [Eulimnogammarus vittatus]
MTKSITSMNSLMKIFTSTFIKLPAPTNISTLWNFGSLLSLCLVVQIVSGLFLASTYSASLETSFTLVTQTMETMDKGWLIRSIHANGASLFFACLYIHVGRGLYYSSFMMTHVWNAGTTMLLLVMATAFMGYVLPSNQMSFWGASVITNLFSEVPYLGPTIVQFIWGGTSVDTPTIMRFFTFHFFLPFITLALVIIHITFLHQTGSNNPLGLSSATSKIKFNSFLSFKDLFGVALTTLGFLYINFYSPLLLSDHENFNPADPSVTPNHIQPEWYFLFAYAILRSIPNKLGGVIALLLSVVILYTLPFTHVSKMKSTYFYPINMVLFWTFIVTVILLTWIGARPVEEPYILTGQILTLLYFSYFMSAPLMTKMWDISIS